MALNALGEVAMNTGAEPEAERLFHESIAMGERGNDTIIETWGIRCRIWTFSGLFGNQ